MGIYGLWPLIKAKGYEPEVVYPSTRAKHLPNATSAVHVDLQACMFVILRQAYSNHPLTVAHGIVEARLSQLVPKSKSVVYIDGLRCKEKEETHASRDEDRQTALNETKCKIEAFAEMVHQHQKASKQTFVGIKKGLSKAFVLTMEARLSLAAFLEHKGWKVVMSTTESDLEIARRYARQDIVATQDSDLLVYGNIERVWRPISGGRFLEPQFTALGIFSKNDYDKNIFSLGPATNHGIVKTLQGSADAKTVVQKYLEKQQVMAKNDERATFATSLRVFVELRQEPLQQEASSDQMPYMILKEEFKKLEDQYTRNRKEMLETKG
ncbi:hypothetical protein EC968_005363 [Mortierella alpina]|nr:hypothetical protein EC968_005363 [Mortierella alpina]